MDSLKDQMTITTHKNQGPNKHVSVTTEVFPFKKGLFTYFCIMMTVTVNINLYSRWTLKFQSQFTENNDWIQDS